MKRREFEARNGRGPQDATGTLGLACRETPPDGFPIPPAGFYADNDYAHGHGTGPYNSGPYGSGPYSGRHSRSPYGTGRHSAGRYSTTLPRTGRYSTGPYNTGPYSTSPYGTGRHSARPYDTGPYVTGAYANGGQPGITQVYRRDSGRERFPYQETTSARQAARTAEQIREAARREADRIRRLASMQAAEMREAAEIHRAAVIKAAGMRSAVMSPTRPRTRTPTILLEGAAKESTREAFGRPGVRPNGRHRARPAKRLAAVQGRPVTALRVAVAATSALVLVGVATGVIEMHRYGYSLFVFRGTGTCKTGSGSLLEAQDPGPSDAQMPTPGNVNVPPTPHSTVTVYNGR